MRPPLHRGIEFDTEAERVGELQGAALERALDELIGDAVLGKERAGLVEIVLVADLEAEPCSSLPRRYSVLSSRSSTWRPIAVS
jgi:hypothetical protein